MSRSSRATTLFLSLLVTTTLITAATSAASPSVTKSKAPPVPDTFAPTPTIGPAKGQADPSKAAAVRFTVTFSEPVTGFTSSDVRIHDTGHNPTAVTLSGKKNRVFTVSVAGLTQEGQVTASVPPDVALDGAGNPNLASTSADATIAYDLIRPDVSINKAGGQAEPTGDAPIHFTAQFSEPVRNFAATDLAVAGANRAKKNKNVTITDSGDHRRFDVAVGSLSGVGTVSLALPAGTVQDLAGNSNTTSTSTDATVQYDMAAPTVTVEQAAGQTDPTGSSPVHFTAQFSEPVTGFGADDVVVGGTAPGLKSVAVTNSGDNQRFDVAVSGMSGPGTVTAAIGAGGAQDAVGNGNLASAASTKKAPERRHRQLHR